MTADTRLAITREPATQARARSSWMALGILAGVGAAGAVAWFSLPPGEAPSAEAIATMPSAEHADAQKLRGEPEATPVVDSDATENAPAESRETDDTSSSERPASAPPEKGEPKDGTKATRPSQSPAMSAGSGKKQAITRGSDESGGGAFSVNVQVRHAGHSCAAQPGGTQITLVVGDFSQRQTVAGCRAAFTGVPAKYKGKTASFAGSGTLCSLSGGGPLGGTMVVGAKRRGAPCSADGVAACECKNPCLGHECL